jgi:glycosyltransferase involved in cell wall biosynthesis
MKRSPRRVVISIYDDDANPYYNGGGPAVVGRIAGSLNNQFDVLVVTAGRRYNRTVRNGYGVITLPLLWAGPRVSQLLWGIALPILAMVIRHDVWIESFTPPVSSSLVPLATRKPVIGLAQALSARSMASRYGVGFLLSVERLLLRTYRDIVVLNGYDAGVISKASPRTQTHLIPNVAPVPPTATDPGLGTFMLYLGRIEMSHKGLDMLLEAHATSAEDLLPLVLAGSGVASEVAELHKGLKDPKDPDNNVHWVGHVSGEAKKNLLASSSFVVVPSREESFCLSALEAMAYGRPVLHFDLPQLSWIPDSCGLKVPRFNIADYTAAMIRLSTDPALCRELGRNARKHAIDLHTRYAGQYVDLVHTVLTS